MKIAVTGGTGFVGKAIVSELLGEGHEVAVLARNAPESQAEDGRRPEYVQGNVAQGEGITELLEGRDALIHLVGIIREAGQNTFDRVHREGTQNVVKASIQAGVKKMVHMSALGTRPDAVSQYHRSKWAGEEAVRTSGLEWTIFRPSIIFGPGDSFVNMLADAMRRSPVMPVPGGGRNLMQPVFVNDVARAFSEAAAHPWSAEKVYELGGPDVLEFKYILMLISQAIEKKRIFINLPLFIVRPAVTLLQAVGVPLPMTTDQLIMMQEDNVRKGGDPLDDFSFDFTPFREGIESYLKVN